MSIVIGRVENKFWSNADHKVPNAFPFYVEQQELKNAEPNMTDFMSGIIYLFGDQWNHCLYKGAYYALHILQVLDEEKKYYCYRLERELWFDVLKAQPRVVGDLINSNNDELLTKHLNRTIGVLDHPAQVVTVNFGKIDFDWRKNYIYKLSHKQFPQPVLSKNSLDSFFTAITDPNTKDWKENNKYFYDGNRNPGLFIFSYIEASYKNDGWKNLLISKVNNLIRNLSGEEGKNYKISKVTTAEGSRLQGNYCLTPKTEGIGTTEEEIKLTKIDLSGLEDIIPVTFHTPDIEIEPFVPMNEGVKGGVFDIAETSVVPFPFLAKVRRKAYLPIGAPEDRRPPNRGFGFSEEEFNWDNVRSPQKVKWESSGKEGVGLLWYVENLNFSADYNKDGTSEVIAGIGGIGYPLRLKDLRKTFAFIKNVYPWGSSFLPLKHVKEGPLLTFGFLLLGLYKDPREWKLFQYNGDIALRKIAYVSGINDSFLIQSREEGLWWSQLKPALAAIQPSQEFAKFYLRNYYFTWLAFFPGTVGGGWNNEPAFWRDIWGTWVYTGNHYTKQGAINSDLHDINGKWKEQNPFETARFPNYLQKLRTTLDSILIKSHFDLPAGLTLEKGDYFFTDQDYDIRNYSVNYANYGNLTKLRKDLASLDFGVGESGRRAFPSVEDFVNPPGSIAFPLTPSKKLIILCGSFEGNIEVRELSSFTTKLSLTTHKTNGQIVKSVDDTTSKENVICTLIKKLTDNLVINETSLLNASEIKEQVIYAFYKANGYKTKRIGSVAYWNWFNEEDFSVSSDRQILFDLKGTDWYCFIAKGKISLIAKSTISFAPLSGKTESLLHSENKDLKIDLIQKINQRVRFQFFNAPYKLNWKTSFTDEDRLFLSYESLSPTDLKTADFEQYFIKLETGFDQIWYENISIPKERHEALSIADSTAIEALGLEKSRIQYAYQIESDRFALAQRRYEENLTRAQNNLDIQKYASWVKFGLSLATSSVSVGTAAKFGGMPPVNNTFTKTTTSYRRLRSKQAMEQGGEGVLEATLAGGSKALYLPYTTNTVRTKSSPGRSRLPAVIPSAVTNVANAIGNLALDHALYFPEVQRQINVERQLGATDLAIQSLSMDTSFLDRQIAQQLALNRAFNVYDNPLISEREILEKFLNKSEWHKGKKLAYAHLVVFIPSDEQLIALRSFKEEYGVMCDIPDISTTFHEGMEPDVIRYRNLDDAAIIGLTNPIIRDFLKVRLLAGIKIIKVTDQITPALTTEFFWDKINTQAAKLDELQNQIEAVKKTSKELCDDEKDKLQKTIEDKDKELSNTRTLLDQKTDELTQIKEGFKQEKQNLEQKLKEDCEKEIKQTKEQLEEEHNKKLRDFLTQRDQAVAAAKQAGFKERDGEVQELKNQLEKCGEIRDHREQDKEHCDLLKKYLEDKYEINLNEREDGGNALRDLVIEIIQEVNWMRRANLDTKLGSSYPTLRPLLDGLMKLQEIPLVARWQDIVSDNFYPDYLKFLREGGDHNGNVDKLIKKINDIKLLDLENVAAAHGLKATLDELNWLSYKAKNQLSEPLKTDLNLQYFFRHIYPAGSLEKYQKLFGDPNIAVTKKRFLEQMQCFKGPGDLPYTNLQVLSNLEKTTRITVDDIDAQTNKRQEEDDVDINLSTKKEDISVYMAPKYTKTAENFITRLSIYKSKYYWTGKFSSSYFSWIYMEGQQHEDKDLSGFNHKFKGGLYLRVLKSDAWTSIMGTRNFLWENRGRIKIDRFEEINRSDFFIFAPVHLIKDSENNLAFSGKPAAFRLKSIFGRYWREAKILLAIMVTNCLSIPGLKSREKPYDNFYSNEEYKTNEERYKFLKDNKGAYWNILMPIEVNIMSAHKNSKELTDFIFDGGKKFNALPLEFADWKSLFNYVYRHIKLNLRRLEDPFGPDYSDTSKINFREILKTIYTSNT